MSSLDIQIKVIKNKTLKAIAMTNDINNNGFIKNDEKELEDFFKDCANVSKSVNLGKEYKELKAQYEQLKASANNQAINQDAQSTNLETSDGTYSKKFIKGAEKLIISKIDEKISKNVNLNDLVDDIKEELKIGISQDPNLYNPIINTLEQVVNAYNDVKASDFKSLEDALKDKLKESNIKQDSYVKDLISRILIIKEQEQYKNEYNRLNTVYTNSETTSISGKIKEVKTESKNDENDQTKKAFKAVKSQAKKDANGIAIDAVNDANGKNWKAIRNNAEDSVETSEDKYLRKAFNKRKIKEESKERKIELNVEDAKEQSKDEVLKALNKDAELYLALKNAELITENENGTVDLTVLSGVLKNQIGSENVLSRASKTDKQISELLKSKSAIATKALEKLTNTQVKDLIDLCGYEIEKPKFGKAALKGATLGALGGDIIVKSITQAVFKSFESTNVGVYNNTFIIKGDDNSFSLEFNIDVEGDGIEYDSDAINNNIIEQITNQLSLSNQQNERTPLITTSTTEAGGIRINITYNSPDEVIPISVNMTEGSNYRAFKDLCIINRCLNGALTGALMGAIAGVINELDYPGERPIISNNFEETDLQLQEYKDRTHYELKNGGFEEFIPIIDCILKIFTDKDGNWDRDGYKDFLNKCGGNGGLINKDELEKACKNYKPEEEPRKPAKHIEYRHEIYTPVREVPITEIIKETIEVPVLTAEQTKVASWASLTKQYDCLLKGLEIDSSKYPSCAQKSPNILAIRILKIVQGINNNDYTKDNILKLVELSYKNKELLKQQKGFSYDCYENYLKANTIGEVKMPDNIAGCAKNNNVSIEETKTMRKEDNKIRANYAKDEVETTKESTTLTEDKGNPVFKLYEKENGIETKIYDSRDGSWKPKFKF